MTNLYKIGFEGEKGQAYASYTDGILRMFINDISKFSTPPKYIPIQEGLLELVERIHTVKLVQARTVAEKVAMFCLLYKEYRQVAYRASKEEKANMKLVAASKDLLHTYFTQTAYPLSGPKSISDYIRHYNAVRDLATNGRPARSTFPDHPDSEYEKTLSPEKLSAYRLHLVQLGWKKVEGVWKRNLSHAH